MHNILLEADYTLALLKCADLRGGTKITLCAFDEHQGGPLHLLLPRILRLHIELQILLISFFLSINTIKKVVHCINLMITNQMILIDNV